MNSSSCRTNKFHIIFFQFACLTDSLTTPVVICQCTHTYGPCDSLYCETSLYTHTNFAAHSVFFPLFFSRLRWLTSGRSRRSAALQEITALLRKTAVCVVFFSTNDDCVAQQTQRKCTKNYTIYLYRQAGKKFSTDILEILFVSYYAMASSITLGASAEYMLIHSDV